jgi:hypothetical protein
MSRSFRGICRPLILCTLLAPGLRAQSVADIVNQMYDAYERQARGIDNYTLVQRAMGVDIVNYFEKESIDGKPVFKLKSSGMQGFSLGMGDEDVGAGDIFVLGPKLIEHGRYAGTEQIDGHGVQVIAVDDASTLGLSAPAAGQDMDFEAHSARFYVDDQMMVPRRLELVGDAKTDSASHEVTMQMNLLDYRNESGLLIPHRAVMQISGLGAMMDADTRQRFEDMQQQLAALPDDQRVMMERMLGPQIEQMKKMMAGEGNAMTIEVTVTEVRVNTGPPDPSDTSAN